MIETGTKGLFNFIEELRKYTEWDMQMEALYDTVSGNQPKPANFKTRVSVMQVAHRVELSTWKDRLKGMQEVLEVEERHLDTILEVDGLRHPLRVLIEA